MARSPPPSLPVAPEHAVLCNRISLLLSKQAALAKALNPPPPSGARPAAAAVDDDDDLITAAAAHPSAGPGFVPDASAARDDRALRTRLLGRRPATATAPGARHHAGSDSDDDEGRTALGKRKRPRPPSRDTAETDAAPDAGHNEASRDEARSADLPLLHAPSEHQNLSPPAAGAAQGQRNKKRSRRKKGRL